MGVVKKFLDWDKKQVENDKSWGNRKNWDKMGLDEATPKFDDGKKVKKQARK